MQTVVVTGAASLRGIGRGVATRLAQHGWGLGLLDVDEKKLTGLARSLRATYGVPVVALAADVTDVDSIDAAARAIEESSELPPVAGLVNCVGISDPTPLRQTTFAQWQRVQTVNTTGVFVVSMRFCEGMIERGYGRIVSLSSTAAATGGGNYSAGAYAASKAAIEGFTHGLALELAPLGVTVNAVSPASIDTDIMGGEITPERTPAFIAQLPVGRLGKVDEVAALIEFLLGPDAGYITGATYNINGGARIG